MGEAYVEMFTSAGCVGCPAVKKILAELAGELDGDVEVEEVDITADTTRAAEYGIMSVPAVVVNGVLKCTGVATREELRKAIAEELGES